MTIFEQYNQLLNELLLMRELEGGDLSQEIESSYVGRLDHLWWQLSDEEQEQLERDFKKYLEAPENLNLIDCDVSIGSNSLPRKKLLDDSYALVA